MGGWVVQNPLRRHSIGAFRDSAERSDLHWSKTNWAMIAVCGDALHAEVMNRQTLLRIVGIVLILAVSCGAAPEATSLGQLDGVWQAEFNHDSSVVLVRRSGGAELWDTNSGNLRCRPFIDSGTNGIAGRFSMRSIRPDGYVGQTLLSPDGKRLFVIHGWRDENRLSLYDAQTMKPVEWLEK